MFKEQKKIRIIMRVLGLATIAVLIIHLVSLYYFNSKGNVVVGNDKTQATRMVIDNREGATSSWKKRDFDLKGTKVDLTGTTIDAVLHNDTTDLINNWTLRINIQGDCYINQCWSGEAEIHQFVGTEKEVVQRLNLQDYDKDTLQFEYYFDGDLLIPLQKGDYIIYYPSEKAKENTVEGGDTKTIGFIFYYLDSLDLSQYELTFTFLRTFTQGVWFVLFVALCAVSVIGYSMEMTGIMVFKMAKKEMEMQKTGLACMSDLYAIIYIISLDTDELVPVFADEMAEANRPKEWGAKR